MTLKVLIVDDDDIFVFLHETIVVDSGLSTNTAGFENGLKAYEYLNNNYKDGETYLILLDINMPEMNGWQFLDTIQTAPYANQVLVAIVTSSIDLEDRVKANGYPQVIDYFEKPMNIAKCESLKRKPEIMNLFYGV